MRTIAVLNQKGGVGKTTTVANTAAALAAMGSKVVAIDLDPQAHLTIHLGLEPQTIRTGSYKVLTQSAKVGQEILLTRLNLWLLPANINLVGAETELVSVVGRETILREGLEEVEDKFDYCFIDCPPSLGLLTLNALAAAQEVLIPLQPHFLALQGFGKLLQTIELVNRRINPDLKVEGVLLCMFDTRASLPSEVRADIEQFLENARGTNCAWAKARILPTFIRRNIKLAEAPSYGKTIFEYEQNCHGAEDYMKVAQFIHGRSQATAQPAVAEQGKAAPHLSEPPQPQPIEKDPGREQPQPAPGPIPQTNSQQQTPPKEQPTVPTANLNQTRPSAVPTSQQQTPPKEQPTVPTANLNQTRPAARPLSQSDAQAPPQPAPRQAPISENQTRPSAVPPPQQQTPQTPPTAGQQPDKGEDRQKPQIQIRSIPQPNANMPPSKPAETTSSQNPPPAQQQ